MKFKIPKSERKKYFGTNILFAVFFHFTKHLLLLIAHFSLLIGHFLGQPNEALLVLKDLQPNRPGKATYLANHKKTGMWPWTQLSASPRIVLFRWKSFLEHVDHAARRAPPRWTTARPRKGTTRSRGRRDSESPRGEDYEGSLVRLRCEAAVAVGPGQRWE